MRRELDEIDAIILDRLQQEGRMTRSSLSAFVGRTIPAVSARIRHLEDDGVIIGFHASLDPKRLRHDVTAFSWVTLRSTRDGPGFIAFLRSIREVLEAHSVTDSTTHVLKLRTENTSTLEHLLHEIEIQPGVERVSTSIVLSTHKETRRLPVNLASVTSGLNGRAPHGTRGQGRT